MFTIQGVGSTSFALSYVLGEVLFKWKYNGSNLALFGTITTITSFLMIGPAPFIPLPITLKMCGVALFLNGIGYSTQSIASLSLAKHAVFDKDTTSNDTTRHALFSSFILIIAYIGHILGPILAGIFVDVLQFRMATMFVLCLQLLLLVLQLRYLCFGKDKGKQTETGIKYEKISQEVTLYNAVSIRFGDKYVANEN